MRMPKKRLAVLREHIKAESTHNTEELLRGMTSDCFNDVACVPRPFVGPKKVAERYRKHWEGFPDFKVRVKRFLAADDKCIVTENEWSGTHRGTYLGLRPTGKRVRVRALVVWHFRGNKHHAHGNSAARLTPTKNISPYFIACNAGSSQENKN